jgi:hypothetical protein
MGKKLSKMACAYHSSYGGKPKTGGLTAIQASLNKRDLQNNQSKKG